MGNNKRRSTKGQEGTKEKQRGCMRILCQARSSNTHKLRGENAPINIEMMNAPNVANEF